MIFIHVSLTWHTLCTKATNSRDVTELRAALKQGLAWGLEEAELQRVTGLWLWLWDAGWNKVKNSVNLETLWRRALKRCL